MRSTSSKLIATLVTALAVTVAGAALHRSSRVSIAGAPLAAENRIALEKALEPHVPADARLTVVIEDRIVERMQVADATPRAARTR